MFKFKLSEALGFIRLLYRANGLMLIRAELLLPRRLQASNRSTRCLRQYRRNCRYYRRQLNGRR